VFQDCCPHNLPGSWTYCLMVQKSNVHQLMLVVEIQWFTGFGIHPRWLFGSSWINNSIAIFFEGSLSPSHDESQTIVYSLFVFVFGVAPFLVNSLSAGIVGLGNSSKRIMRTRMFYYKCQCIKSSELGVWGQCSMKCLQSLILKHVFALTCSLIYYVKNTLLSYFPSTRIRTCMGRSRGLPLFPWRAFSNLRPSLSISTVESCNSSRCCLKMVWPGRVFAPWMPFTKIRNLRKRNESTAVYLGTFGECSHILP